MLSSPTVRDDGSGSAVLVKHAAGIECSRLRHEAELLETIRSEGVVIPVGFDESEGRCELRLQYLEAATLAEHPPLGLADVLDVLIAVGTTLADLHRQGICHGALSRDHVLLERPLRPVLCGFGDATGPADPEQHPVGTDLDGIAAIAEKELTRTDRKVAGAAERRSCGDALIASRDLAAAAADAPHDGAALHTWIARLGAIRHAPNSIPLEVDVRGPHLAPERMPSSGDRRRIAAWAPAAAIALVAIAGWRVLAGGGASPQTANAPRPAGVPIGPITSIVAPDIDTSQPDSAPMTEPDVPGEVPAPPQATPSVDDATDSGATLLYGTARRECPDGAAPGGGDGGSDDCADSPSPAEPGHQPSSGLLTLPSGQWAIVEPDDLPSLSCDVVVVHYGELSIESGRSAVSAPDRDAAD